MFMIFVDANFFLWAFTEPPDQDAQYFYDAAIAFLHRAEGDGIEFTTSDAVLAEVAYTLTSKRHHNIPVTTAAEALASIVRRRGFRYGDKRILLRALDIWTEFPRIGFVDALTAAYARTPGMLLATFDSDFDRLPGIDRWQPDHVD
jgi:predicted nucleic acid-binding protein